MEKKTLTLWVAGLATVLAGCAHTRDGAERPVTPLAEQASLTVARFDRPSDVAVIKADYEPAIGAPSQTVQVPKANPVKWEVPPPPKVVAPPRPAAPPAPRPQPMTQMPVTPPPMEKKLVFNDTMFAFNKATLSKKALAALREVLTAAKEGKTIGIVGHTDSIGPDTYNDKLSLKRAETVKAYLLKNGVETAQIVMVEGHGRREPLASNETEEGRAKNRRAEVTITIIENLNQQGVSQ